MEFTIDQKEKYGFYTSSEAALKRVFLEMDRAVTDEMDNLMKLKNEKERDFQVVSMRKNPDNFLLTRKLDMSDNGSDA